MSMITMQKKNDFSPKKSFIKIYETNSGIMTNLSTPNSVICVTFSNRVMYCVDLQFQITKIYMVSLFDTWNRNECVFPTRWTLHTMYELT